MSEQTTTTPTARSPFLPILLLALTLLALLVFQTVQLQRERNALVELSASQEKPLEESKRMRNQLGGIARDTANLAEQGNANAAKVIEELKKRGITINPNAAGETTGPIE